MLTPKWEELAGKLKNTVKVAYVDTEAGPTPSSVGQIKGTPTIKAFVPRRTSARNEKQVVDYDQAREVQDLIRFATSRMPNFVETVADDAALTALEVKAAEWRLPLVLAFSNKVGQTSTTLKALSAEYRRRVLLGELRMQKHAMAVARHSVRSFPTLVCIGVHQEEVARFEKKEASYRRLDTFISKCALRKPVLKKPDIGGSPPTKQEL